MPIRELRHETRRSASTATPDEQAVQEVPAATAEQYGLPLGSRILDRGHSHYRLDLVLNPLEVGIFAVDPGGSTGVAWGVFNLRQPLVKDAMRYRKDSDSATITGTEQQQIPLIADMWYNFNEREGRNELVIEDFVLRPGIHKPGKEGISPVRYGWGLAGYLWGLNDEIGNPKIVWQSPSKGMRYNERQMLENWHAWIVGREHERAAFAHVGARLMDIFQ